MEKLKQAPTRKDFAKDPPNIGFYLSAHHKALELWAKKADAKIKELEHYRDTTLGLYATDKPELIEDKQGLMFELRQ